MMNQIILVGRISNIQKLDKQVILTLAISRPYKNPDTNLYETDFIPTILYNTLAQNTLEFTKIGDIVGIRGRIEKTTPIEELHIIADKVTFLQQKTQDTKQNTNN